jgi:hypothetical protein
VLQKFALMVFAKEVLVMADSCLNFAKRETERLDTEIEGLQGSIRLHNETKNAWDTILRNAGSQSQGAYLELANSESARLDGEIEAVQEEIRRHNQIKDAWDTIVRNTGSESHLCQGILYAKGEDVEWHLQRLDKEIEVLQCIIRRHNQAKEAWDVILGSAESESKAAYLEVANPEIARLDGEIEKVQQEIRRRLETRNAWDTIMRNAASESRIYQGAMYLRGWDGQWHLQPTEAAESNEESERRRTSNAVSKVHSMRQALLDACDRTFRVQPKHVTPLTHGKEQFQSLGLR